MTYRSCDTRGSFHHDLESPQGKLGRQTQAYQTGKSLGGGTQVVGVASGREKSHQKGARNHTNSNFRNVGGVNTAGNVTCDTLMGHVMGAGEISKMWTIW